MRPIDLVSQVLVGALVIASGGMVRAGTDPAVAAPCSPSADLRASLEHTTAGIQANHDGDPDRAHAELAEATELRPDNHTAWYQLGLADEALHHDDDAAADFEKAVALSDGDAMYHMMLGIARYRASLASATTPDMTDADAAALELGQELQPARDELEAAVAINPALFRAHYYLGRIHRHQGDAAAAAASFSAAISYGPHEVDPYVALAELYRGWQYEDEANQVLREGIRLARDTPERIATLDLELGVACYESGDDACAIDALTAALDLQDSLVTARFQRGMSYYRQKDYAHAKEDLARVVASRAAGNDYLLAIAQQTLLEIDARGER